MSKMDKILVARLLNEYKSGAITRNCVYNALLELGIMKEPKVVKNTRINPSNYNHKTTLILGDK